MVSVIATPSTASPPSMLVVRSERSIPASSSTSGPFEPSPGYGPAVSVGNSSPSAEAAVESPESLPVLHAARSTPPSPTPRTPSAPRGPSAG